MHFSCSWCQKEAELDQTLTQNNVDNLRFICGECLIPLMSEPEEVDDETFDELLLPSNESRRSRRYSLFSEILICMNSDCTETKKALILEISQTGFKIITTEKFKTSDFIEIMIEGLDKKIKNTAEIIYCLKILDQKTPIYQIGIRLIDEFKFPK